MTNKDRTCNGLIKVSSYTRGKENVSAHTRKCGNHKDDSFQGLNIISIGRDIPLAKCLAEHYYENNGTPVTLTRKVIDASPTIQKLSERNAERLNKTFVGKGDKKVGEQLQNLPVGESVDISDHWDAAVSGNLLTIPDNLAKLEIKKAWNTSLYYFTEPNTKLSLGSMQVGSDFTGTAKREGNTITIHGTLNHKLKDVYDFDESFDNEYLAAKNGCAKPFVSEAVWSEGIVGSVKVDEKGLGNPIIKTYSLEEE